jgi:hypothetical protein
MLRDIRDGTGEEAKKPGRGMTAERKQGGGSNDNTALGNNSEQWGPQGTMRDRADGTADRTARIVGKYPEEQDKEGEQVLRRAET